MDDAGPEADRGVAGPDQPRAGAALDSLAKAGGRPDDDNASGLRALRRRTYDIIDVGAREPHLSRAFDTIIVTLIVLNIIAFVLETVPHIQSQWGTALRWFEVFSVMIFTAEYAARIWTAVEVPFLARLSPARARLSLAKRPALLIDLAAIVPFYLGSLFGVDLRALRALRLLRFLKLSRYSPAMYTLIRVLANERRALLGAGLLLATALLFTSTTMYYLEGEAQPDKFGSVPDAAWWAIATLTTVGYGDVTPVTTLGRMFAGMTMVVGLCILALPVAIIATGFAQELSRRDFVVTWSLMSRVPLLSELDARQVADLMPLLHAHNLPPNFEVAAKGAPGDAMFFVAAGQVEQHGDDAVRTFATGDCFGATAIFSNDVHAGSFITSTKCKLLKLHKADFHQLEVRHPALAAQLKRHAIAQHHSAA